MSELSDLVGVLGAIDDHVVGRQALVSEVGRLLCPYRYGAAGWFPVFQEWVESGQPADQAPLVIPGLDEALENLANSDPDEQEDPGLRLLSIAVLARVMPEYGPGGSEVDKTLGALSVPGLANGDAGRAVKLLDLLADSEQFPDASRWDAMMLVAVEEHLIAADSARPLRCDAKVVYVDLRGQPHPATALTTSFVADDLTFAEATAFLDPSEWPHCCPAWCFMTPAAGGRPGSQRYEEKIGVVCPTPILTTCLEFRRVDVPNMAVVSYDLSPPSNPDCRSDGKVLVDQGSIQVHDRSPDPGVSVTTTKRVLFRQVPPEPLAMWSCIFGYADVAHFLVYQCARRQKDKPKLPGKKPAKKAAKKKPGRKLKPSPPPTPMPGPDNDCAEVVNDLAKLAKDCVTDSAASYRANMDKVATGTYAASDAAKDVATVLQRAARDVARAIDLGNRAVEITTRDAAPAEAPEPEEDE